MRAIFGVVGLLVVVAIVGLLARKQLGAGTAPRMPDAAGQSTPAATPRQQVQQFEQAVQGAMQQARPMPDEGK
jgi:hypothetical protein